MNSWQKSAYYRYDRITPHILHEQMEKARMKKPVIDLLENLQKTEKNK